MSNECATDYGLHSPLTALSGARDGASSRSPSTICPADHLRKSDIGPFQRSRRTGAAIARHRFQHRFVTASKLGRAVRRSRSVPC